MKNLIIAFICLISFQMANAQNITPFENGTQIKIPMKTKKDFRLPVSILRADGGMSSSVKIESFEEVQFFKSEKKQDNSSKLAHQYYMTAMKKNGFVEIFRCKDACKNILKLIASNLLPKGHSEVQTLENVKRYSYTIFHKKDAIAVVITIHSDTKHVRNLIAISNLK